MKKKVLSILLACTMGIGFVQAQQPLVASTEFQFNKPVPSARLKAAAAAAKELMAARDAVATALPENQEAAQEKLAIVQKRIGQMPTPIRDTVDFFITHKTAQEWQNVALSTRDFDLLALALADSPNPVDERLFADLVSWALLKSLKPTDDNLSFVEQLLIRARNIPQQTRDKLLRDAVTYRNPDFVPLLMYGGVITIDGKEYPVEGGARGDIVTRFSADSVDKIISTKNLDGKSAADLGYLQQKRLPVEKRHEWWKEIDDYTLEAVKRKLADPRVVVGPQQLFTVAVFGFPALVELLLDKGIDVNARNSLQATPLHAASRSGQLEVVRVLLARNADVNAKDRVFKGTPLHDASDRGYSEVVKELLAKNADVNARDKRQFTPLHLASWSGRLDIVRLLIDSGADVNAFDENHFTPLNFAIDLGYLAVVRLLLDSGAGVNARDNDQETPLHSAAREGYLDVARLLIERGADVNARDKDQVTPLHLASKYGRSDVVRILLDSSADANARDGNGHLPLDMVSGSSYEVKEIVKLLREAMKKETLKK